MRRAITVCLVALALGLSCVPVLSDITGTVVDNKGKPVAKAKVSATYGTQAKYESKETTTDIFGKFKFSVKSAPQDGFVYVYADADGYAPANSQGKFAVDTPIKLTLQLERLFKLKVVDSNGKPVQSAGVQYECQAWGNGNHFFYRSACCGPTCPKPDITDKNGCVIIKYTPDPKDFSNIAFTCSIDKSGLASINRRRYSLKDYPGDITVTLQPECKLEGVIYLPGKTETAPEGTRISARTIHESYDKNWGKDSDSRTVSTDKSGKFVFTGLGPGKYDLLLGDSFTLATSREGKRVPEQKPWTFSAMHDVELSPDKPQSVEIETVPACLVKGKLINKRTGLPIKDAVIAAVHNGRPEDIVSTALTGEKGDFSIYVAPGDVSVRLMEVDENFVHIDDTVSTSFTMASGQEKNDIIFNYVPTDDPYSVSSGFDDPIPSNFALKSGTYALSWDPDVNCSLAIHPKMVYTGKDVKSRIKRYPHPVSSDPRHAAFRFDGEGDDGLIMVVIDESQGTGKGWDTAYIDLNRNLDLTDDEPVHWKPNGNCEANSPWVSAKTFCTLPDIDKTNNTIDIRISSYVYNGLRLDLERKGALHGKIESNKGIIDCAFVDSNGNGIYGEPGEDAYIDTNGYGKLSMRPNEVHDVKLNKTTQLAGKFYSINVSKSGDSAKIEPYTGAMGTLIMRAGKINGIPIELCNLNLTGSCGEYTIPAPECNRITLPVGDYKLDYANLQTKSGETHMFCEFAQSAKIEAGKENVVDIDGTLSFAINPDDKELVYKPNTTARIKWMITLLGKSATIRSVSSGSEGSPKVKFFDSNHKMVGFTTANYSCCGSGCGYAFSVPDVEPGKYTMQIALDTKSGLGTLISKRQVRVEP